MSSEPEQVPPEELIALLHGELKKLAAARLARERVNHTLSPTALVNEVYMRLTDPSGAPEAWSGKAHFFAAAAEAMRRVLVDHARAHKAFKRGGGRERDASALDWLADGSVKMPDVDMLALDAAMIELKLHDARSHQVVMYRFFAGLTLDQTAAAMNVSDRQVTRIWKAARTWLFTKLADSADDPGGAES